MPIACALSDRAGRKSNWNIPLIGIGVPVIPLFGLMGITFRLALLGGTAALVSNFFVESTDSLLVPVFYMTIAYGIGLIALYFKPETAGGYL